MKKRLYRILLFAFFVIFSGVIASAEEKYGYLISQSDESFSLYELTENGQRFVCASSDATYLLALTEGAFVTLDGVRFDDSITLDGGEYFLSGTADVCGTITVCSDTKLTLDGAELSFVGASSYLRIKGGEVDMLSGNITSCDGSALILDYSAKSSFLMYGGELSSLCDAALIVRGGSAEIYGGSVTSLSNSAIENYSTLTISGSPIIISSEYSVTTDKPISVSSSYGQLSTTIRVKYLSEFKKGSKTEVLRNCSAYTLSLVTLYDKNGNVAALDYFEYDKRTAERNFGAVFLPYIVSMFDNGALIGRMEFLYSDELLSLSAPQKQGYTFVGWFSDEELTSSFVPLNTQLSDLEIYASYRLKSPEFSLSSLSFTYDKGTRILSLDRLYHELEEEGRYELEWFKNGKSIGIFDGGVKIKNVTDSGEYSCRITFFHGSEAVSVTTPCVSVNVDKMKIASPECESVNYNGRLQYSSLSDNSLYTVDGVSGISVGKYPLTITLRNPENYEFDTTTEEVLTLYFEITKAENVWIDEPQIRDIYQNQTPSPSAYPLFGEAYFLFSDKPNKDFSVALPTFPGIYYAKAVVDENDNYGYLESDPIPFRIYEEVPIGITVISPPSKTEYEAFELFSYDGLVLEILYNSNRRELVPSHFVAVTYQNADDIRYGDSGVTISVLGCEVMIPITVKKCKYDITSIVFTDQSFIYDGAAHTLSYSGELPVGKDGIAVRAIVNGSFFDVGRYEVTLNFYSESKNYEPLERMIAYLEITPLVCYVRWSGDEFIYDGTAKLPSVEFTDAFGRVISLTPSGAVIGATSSALAEVVSPSDNYVFSNPSYQFAVKKADYDFSGVTWDSTAFVFDGRVHKVSVSGLPEGVYVIGYIDDVGVNAGKYKTTAVIYYDESNYNPPPTITHEWEILPAAYDLTVFYFADNEAVFDGEYHYPTLIGEMPTGYDGIRLRYEFSGGAIHVSDGRIAVTVDFYTDSKNYLAPESVIAFVEITPMPISVAWEYDGGVYDGKGHLPRAKSEFCEITVIGEGVNAGIYIATALSINSDFEIINPSYIFTVSQAENYWIESLKINDIFTGELINPTAKPFAGEVSFGFYKDERCSIKASFPLIEGEYFVRAEVFGLENYSDLVSEAIKFSVIPVVVTDIEVIFAANELRAFSVINKEDIEIYAIYNNGKKTQVLFKNVNVSYQSADSLRAVDRYFIVSYGEFSVEIPITVKKAEMDKSEFIWGYSETVYDGNLLYPTLVSLPYGVSVSSYSGGGVSVGEYTVSAVIEYDSDNYEPPPEIFCIFKIKKRTLNAPVLPSVTYDKNVHFPRLESDLYTVTSQGFVNVGEYTVYAELIDSENYIFENGDTRIPFHFTIEKRVIRARVSPMILYLDTEPYMPSYELFGEALDGDDLLLYYEIIDGTAYIKSANPNYEIASEGGEVTFKSFYSKEAYENVAILTALVIGLIATTLLVFFSKDKILHKISAVRCKRHFAKEKYNEIPSAQITPGQESTDHSALPDFYNDKSTEGSQNDIMSVDIERANSLLTDSMARSLLRCEGDEIPTCGKKRFAINVDTLSDNFDDGERVDVNSLKKRNLIAKDIGYIKVLARGEIDKKLFVYANAFSLSAVKMIALTGGVAVKVTHTQKSEEKKRSFDEES